MEKDSIKTEIADRQAIKEANATLASQRIQKIIKEGKDQHALGASIFSIEQVDGKAKQVIQQHSKHTLVTYDLSGGTAGDVPQHILDALEGE